jgi:hypothetical protein
LEDDDSFSRQMDYVTQDMIIEILGGEEDHRRGSVGFMREYRDG